MSTAPYQRARPAETVAGFLAAAAIFVSLTGIMYRPLRLIPLAIVLALVAVGIGGRGTPPATRAVGVAAASFAPRLPAPVVTSNPLWAAGCSNRGSWRRRRACSGVRARP